MSHDVLKIALTEANLQETLTHIRLTTAKVIVSNSPASLSGELITALRSERNHIPFISVVNPNEVLPKAILNNCCGPKFLRTDSAEKLDAVVAEMMSHVHAEHC